MPRKKQPCTVNGVRYESESAATKALDMNLVTLRTRLRSSNFPEYASKHHRKIKRGKKIAPKDCSIKGVEYPSITAAARKLKMNANTLSNRLKSSNYPDYVCAGIPKVSKPVKYGYTVNGRKYRTLQEIGDMEGLTRERIRQKMNSPKHPAYQKLSRPEFR